MSLDVYLIRMTHVSYDNCQTWVEKPELVFEGNITHNLNKMADELGVYEELWRPEEKNITKAGELITILEIKLNELKENPEKYKKFNPVNGWGSYKGLIEFMEKYLEACKQYPEAIIEVSR